MKPLLAALALATLACAPVPAISEAPRMLPSPTPLLVAPSDAPSPLVSAEISPTPSPRLCPDGSLANDAPSFGSRTHIVAGRVLDAAGAPVHGAQVRAVSLDPAVPYSATALTFQGTYVFNAIPQDIRVSYQATAPSGAVSDTVIRAFAAPVEGCRYDRPVLDFVLGAPLPGPSLAPASSRP